jgi:hypothetical protein
MSELRAYQPSFTAGELSPALWARVDLAKYASGLKSGTNLFIHPHGGVSNRAGLEFIREVKTSALATRLIPFQFNTEQSYILEFGNLYMRVYRDGGLVLNGGSPYEIATPYTADQVSDLVFTQEADVMYFTHVLHAPRKLGRVADNNWTLTTPTFAPVMTAPTTVEARDSDYGTISVTNVTAADPAVITAAGHGYSVGHKFSFTTAAANGADLLGRALSITAVTTNTFTVKYDRSDRDVVTSARGGRVYAGANKRFSYRVSAVNASGEESLPSAVAWTANDLSIAGQINRITWSEVAGAVRYIVYKADNRIYGYVGSTGGRSFDDENITADISDTPQTGYNPFVGANNYPRCSTFIDQRLAFASTLKEPQACWFSQSGNYENFGYSSPRKASDGFEFRIRARQVNEIRALLQMRGLMVLTSGGEWVVTGGPDEYLSPTNIVTKPQGYRGSSKAQPIVVGNTVLFSQERGGVIRDFSYEFAEDTFVGKDLTILARHLFEGRSIKSWAYSQAPYSIVWVVLDDGSLVSMTYLKEHDVWGWTRQKTDGVFEDVAVIGEGQEDVPYFIVRRTIGGVQKRYIERLHTREFSAVEDAFFVDSGLTYSGAPVSVVSGLGHLEGKEVVALADGNVVRGLTVVGGSVALQSPASKIHVGLPYEAVLTTLDLDMGMVAGLGSVQGRQKSVSEVTFRVEKTRGIWLGTVDASRESGKLVEYKQRAGEAWGLAIALYTGDFQITPMSDWTNGGNIVVKQFDPLPMTILAVMPDITVGK